MDSIRGTGWIIERLYGGDTQEVIALELGVTASRVSQMMRREKLMARRVLMLTTELVEYHADPEASLLEVEWITV